MATMQRQPSSKKNKPSGSPQTSKKATAGNYSSSMEKTKMTKNPNERPSQRSTFASKASKPGK